MTMPYLDMLWSRPLCHAVGVLNKRMKSIWHRLYYPSLPSMSPELQSSAQLLFAEMDRPVEGI